MTKPQKSPQKIPQFASPEEEAEFWDTHDTADFEKQMRPAPVRFSRNLSRGITIRLDTQTLDSLRERAHNKGIGPTTLIRMWVLERLREDSQTPSESR